MRKFFLISTATAYFFNFNPLKAQTNEERVLDSLLALANQKTMPFVVNENVSVEAYRFSVGNSGVAKDAAGIQENYTGQDMPTLLQNTPSVVTYTDGGNFNGYGYFRVRGIDQTRVNVSLNGVPLSEPEDQGAYFSNYTDLGNNIESMQLLRGASISTNGTAAFAGALSMESPHIIQNFGLGNLQVGFGSFDAYKVSAAYNTGLLPNRFAFYGRFSTNANQGYRDNSGNNSNNFFMSMAYVPNVHNTIKITAFRGNAKNQMAYLATNLSDIKTNPKTNYLRDDERDDFTQHFAQIQQIFQKRIFNSRVNLKGTSSLYYINIDGNYDIFSALTMLNLNLKSHQFGGFANAIFSYRPHYNKFINEIEATAGVHYNNFHRHHYLVAKPFVSRQDAFYDNTGFKSESSGFIKLYAEALKRKLQTETSFQLRGANFTYRPDIDYNMGNISKDWLFFNYRMAASYKIIDKIKTSLSFAACRREPTRTDLLGNYDDIDSSILTTLGDFNRVKPEQVFDWEWNTNYTLYKNIYLRQTVYFMNFRNEIAAIGQLNNFGIPLRQNVDKSYRAGAELTLNAFLLKYKLRIELNAAYNYHRIQRYTTAFNGQTYTNVRPLLTPDWQGYLNCNYEINDKIQLMLQMLYVDKSFLSNENDADYMLPAYFVPNFRVNYSPKAGHNLGLSLNNLTNKAYYSAGYVGLNEPAYFVQAPFNFFLIYNLYF